MVSAESGSHSSVSSSARPVADVNQPEKERVIKALTKLFEDPATGKKKTKDYELYED